MTRQPQTRYRITVRGSLAELRGSIVVTLDELNAFAIAMKPTGMVVASPMDEQDRDYIQQAEQTRDAFGLAREALLVIAEDGCERYTADSGMTCRTAADLTLRAEFSDDRWCSACAAAYGLGK